MSEDTPRVACPACRRAYAIDDTYLGRAFRCHCGEIVEVPAAATDGSESPERAPPPPPRTRPDRPAADSGQSVVVFVLGLAGLLAGCLCWVGFALCAIAWMLGHRERARLRDLDHPVPGLLTAGWIMGIVGSVLLGALVAVVVAFLLLG